MKFNYEYFLHFGENNYEIHKTISTMNVSRILVEPVKDGSTCHKNFFSSTAILTREVDKRYPKAAVYKFYRNAYSFSAQFYFPEELSTFDCEVKIIIDINTEEPNPYSSKRYYYSDFWTDMEKFIQRPSLMYHKSSDRKSIPKRRSRVTSSVFKIHKSHINTTFGFPKDCRNHKLNHFSDMTYRDAINITYITDRPFYFVKNIYSDPSGGCYKLPGNKTMYCILKNIYAFDVAITLRKGIISCGISEETAEFGGVYTIIFNYYDDEPKMYSGIYYESELYSVSITEVPRLKGKASEYYTHMQNSYDFDTSAGGFNGVEMPFGALSDSFGDTNTRVLTADFSAKDISRGPGDYKIIKIGLAIPYISSCDILAYLSKNEYKNNLDSLILPVKGHSLREKISITYKGGVVKIEAGYRTCEDLRAGLLKIDTYLVGTIAILTRHTTVDMKKYPKIIGDRFRLIDDEPTYNIGLKPIVSGLTSTSDIVIKRYIVIPKTMMVKSIKISVRCPINCIEASDTILKHLIYRIQKYDMNSLIEYPTNVQYDTQRYSFSRKIQDNGVVLELIFNDFMLMKHKSVMLLPNVAYNSITAVYIGYYDLIESDVDKNWKLYDIYPKYALRDILLSRDDRDVCTYWKISELDKKYCGSLKPYFPLCAKGACLKERPDPPLKTTVKPTTTTITTKKMTTITSQSGKSGSNSTVLPTESTNSTTTLRPSIRRDRKGALGIIIATVLGVAVLVFLVILVFLI